MSLLTTWASLAPRDDSGYGQVMDTIDDLSAAWLATMLDAEPLEATLLGYPGRDAHLADLSVEHEEVLASRFAELRTQAEEWDPHMMSHEERVTRDVLLALDDAGRHSRAAGTIDFTVAAFPVSPASVLLAYLRMIPIGSDDQGRDYLLRLSEIPRFLEQALERLERGRRAGLTPVRRLVESAIAQIDSFLREPAAVLGNAPGEGVTDADAWVVSRDDVIHDLVVPAFREYREALLHSVLPTARPDASPGLAHLPDGQERYRHLVELHTTTTRSAEDLHAEGQRLVAQVHDEFRALGREALGTDDLSEIFRRLREDPDLRWETAEQILQAAESAVRRAESIAPDWFGRVPLTACALAAIPPLEAAGAAPAYYMPPTVDGTRPGTYYSNVNNPTERTSFDLEAVAFHEAVPGHHFQIALALENPDIPALRRLPLFTAYIEGWGLYAERLADEMGLYSSPQQRLGMLSADAWRAARLVVDTGLHHYGWSRDEAVAYLRDNTAVAPIDVESEIDRYIAYPGQALSYMTGRREIERLRRRAERAHGPSFDIGGFHDRVLADGALPLTVLDVVMAEWEASA